MLKNIYKYSGQRIIRIQLFSSSPPVLSYT